MPTIYKQTKESIFESLTRSPNNKSNYIVDDQFLEYFKEGK